MDYGKYEDTVLRVAAFVVKVLFVACLAAMAKGAALLASLDYIGAIVWFFGGVYSMCMILVAIIILAQR